MLFLTSLRAQAIRGRILAVEHAILLAQLDSPADTTVLLTGRPELRVLKPKPTTMLSFITPFKLRNPTLFTIPAQKYTMNQTNDTFPQYSPHPLHPAVFGRFLARLRMPSRPWWQFPHLTWTTCSSSSQTLNPPGAPRGAEEATRCAPRSARSTPRADRVE